MFTYTSLKISICFPQRHKLIINMLRLLQGYHSIHKNVLGIIKKKVIHRPLLHRLYQNDEIPSGSFISCPGALRQPCRKTKRKKRKRKVVKVQSLNRRENRSLSQRTHKLRQRSIPILLKKSMTTLTNTQTTKHTAVSNLLIILVTGHARNGTPDVLRNGHISVFLETGEMDFIQWCCDGLVV